MINAVDAHGQVQQDVVVDQLANMVMIITHNVFQFREHQLHQVVRRIHLQHPLPMMDAQMVLQLVIGIAVRQVVLDQAKH